MRRMAVALQNEDEETVSTVKEKLIDWAEEEGIEKWSFHYKKFMGKTIGIVLKEEPGEAGDKPNN